jgi:hypothetical protein
MTGDYIHTDDAYEWLRDKDVQFAEQDFARAQAERDALARCVEQFIKAWIQLESAGTQKTIAMVIALEMAEKALHRSPPE